MKSTTAVGVACIAFLLQSVTADHPGGHQSGGHDMFIPKGCVTDSVSARTLLGMSTTSPDMSAEYCSQFCKDYQYFGTEFGDECYCGLTVATTSEKAYDSDCNVPCDGDASEMCGGPARMNLYRQSGESFAINPIVLGWEYAGCHSDSVSNRVLNDAKLFQDNMTPQVCANFCKGYQYFGTEFGSQCYCGNQFTNPTSSICEDDCGFLCPGSIVELCGGAGALSLYRKFHF